MSAATLRTWACLAAIGLAAELRAEAPAAADLRRTPVVEVFDRTHGAVVNISSTRVVRHRLRPSPFDLFFSDDIERFFGARPRASKFKTTSVGSGFVIHQSGYVVTNAHVVDRTTDVKVMFDDERSYDAEVVAIDRTNDLALLRIACDTPLQVIRFGSSDDLMIGETVIAIGNPLGYQHTLTTGVVSAVNRDLELVNEKAGEPLVYPDLIQTDASINPGNSGGPLLNILGQLIGVNTAIRSDAQNIGFAIPVTRLKQTLPAMLAAEQRNRFALGLELNSECNAIEVWPDSPAHRAGIRLNDTITHVDRQPVHSSLDTFLSLLGHRPGDTVVLDFLRAGKPRSTQVRLQERLRPDGKQLAVDRLGLVLAPLSTQAARSMNLPKDYGLIVTEVLPHGPADAIKMLPGDILISLDDQYVDDLDELGRILDGRRPGAQLYIRILRVEGPLIYGHGAMLTLR